VVTPVTGANSAGHATLVGGAPAHFGLVVNPAAGAASHRAVERLRAALREAGRSVEIFGTTRPGGGADQAAAALRAGCDAVIACGGDGTVHEVLQAIVATGSRVPLGVLPLGTGNVIAHDLGIPRDPNKAAAVLLEPARRRVTVGRVEVGGNPRYFLALVGVGCDAHALYHMSAAAKSRLGMIGYYLQSFRSLLTHDFTPFAVEFSAEGESRTEVVTQVLAVRLADLGGMLRRLAPGAALERDDLRLVLFRGRGRLPFVRYMTAVVLGRTPRVRGVELVYADSLKCFAPAAPGCVRVQADGEYLGPLPATVTLVPRAVELLAPRSA
jgi:diacylglycerol kinase (ATP)